MLLSSNRYTNLLLISVILACYTEKAQSEENPSNKLLILGLDGLRWDIIDSKLDSLQGIAHLIQNGAKAEYVEPIFPSLTYPSWTTIFTGLHPENHQIIGNYMLHLPTEKYPEELLFDFQDPSTQSSLLWWESVDPLWANVASAGKKLYSANFGYCQMEYHASPYRDAGDCIGFSTYNATENPARLRSFLDTALQKLQAGYSFASIYDVTLDYAGHIYGGNSAEYIGSIQLIDGLINEFLQNMTAQNMTNDVNIIIIGDHGQTPVKVDDGIVRINLTEYISGIADDVYKVVDFGAIATIQAVEGKADMVYDAVSKMPGVDVYKKSDIPEEFYYKKGHAVLDILIVAKPGNFMLETSADKQHPNHAGASYVKLFSASHGYYNMSDMRPPFIAYGPYFKKGYVHPWIRLVDEYQIFTHVLKIEPKPHNGSWDRVKDMFV